MIFKLFVLIMITVASLSVVPFIQFIVLYFRRHKNKYRMVYYFSRELFDYDMNRKSTIDITINRRVLANRGWVRYPNGKVITETDFEEKKKEEYQIELP